jgi:hypothetical protein
MDGIEVAVELQSATWPPAFESNDHRRSRRVVRDRPLDREALGLEQFGKAIGRLTCVAGRAGDGYEPARGFDQPLAIDGRAQLLADIERHS